MNNFIKKDIEKISTCKSKNFNPIDKDKTHTNYVSNSRGILSSFSIGKMTNVSRISTFSFNFTC